MPRHIAKPPTSDLSPETRRPYSPPKLKEFGPVGALTQAGTGLSSEVMNNGMLAMSPSKRA
jgi:hypothetical protein